MIHHSHLRRRGVMLFATAVATTSACPTGVDDVGTAPTPFITLSITPTSATVVQGGSTAIEATLTGSGGFTGAGAAFIPTGAPPGVTFAVSNLQTSGSVTTATITAAVGATVSPGTYAVSLTGSGTGVKPVSASFALTVPAPSIALIINPTSATVPQGGSVGVGAILTGSGGFTGAGVAFTMTGAPAGVTFAISNPETSGWITGSVTTTTVTTSIAATVPPGTYTIILTGSGTGVSPVSASFALSVVALGFTLSVNPATLTLCEGCGDATATITISRINGFAGSVQLAVSTSFVGQGGAFTTGLDRPSTTGSSSILTVSTTAPPGNYTITITATAPGFVTQIATIAATVL